MKVAFYNYKEVYPPNPLRHTWTKHLTLQYDRESFEQANLSHGNPLDITFLRPSLDASTAPLAKGHDAVCLFVNDDASAKVIKTFQANNECIDTKSLRSPTHAGTRATS
jgi:D-lactate dehydrogenase